jgi:hypothetical protein
MHVGAGRGTRIGRAIRAPLCALALAALTACDAVSPCGTERAFTLGGAFEVTAVAAGPSVWVPREIDVATSRIGDAALAGRPGVFDDLWSTLFERGTLPTSSGIALSMVGRVPNVGQSFTRMAVVLPTPLAEGVEFPIDRAFAAAVESVLTARYLGRSPLATAGHAEIALTHGIAQDTHFVATAATGTVRVIEVDDDDLRVRLDVTLTDASGTRIHLRGDLVGLPEVRDVPCAS